MLYFISHYIIIGGRKMKIEISPFDAIMNGLTQLDKINKQGIEPTQEEVDKKVKEIFPEEFTNNIVSDVKSFIDSLFVSN
jgi:hypothetical protein